MTNQYVVEDADDIDIEQEEIASSPVGVYRLVDAKMQRQNGKTKLHMTWEPLSFKQVFNKEKYTFRTDDYTHDWLTAMTSDGRLMGNGTQFGKVKEAIEGIVGIKLTKNEVFSPILAGKVFKAERKRESFAAKDRATGEAELNPDGTPRMINTYHILPIEELDDYDQPADVKTVRYGFDQSSAEVATVSAEQVSALKHAVNGKSEEEYVDALIDSGDALIVCDPFMSEAGNGVQLTDRLKALGGKIVSGRIYFADVVS